MTAPILTLWDHIGLGMVAGCVIFALAAAWTYATTCTESIGYSRCDVGAVVSREGDDVVCRCPAAAVTP